jgi:hypothetical protein
MCQQLGSIGRTVGKDVVLKSVLDELFELLKDEENQVSERVGEIRVGDIEWETEQHDSLTLVSARTLKDRLPTVGGPQCAGGQVPLGRLADCVVAETSKTGAPPTYFCLILWDDSQVRAAAYTSLIALLDLLPPDVRKSRVLPILRDHMQPFDMDVTMQRCIARNFGQMLIVVGGCAPALLSFSWQQLIIFISMAG